MFRSRYTRRLDGLAICTMANLLVADQWQTVRATTNLWNALGTSDEWTCLVVAMRGSSNAAVVFAGAFLTVSTCTAISCCGGIQHFLVGYTDSTTVLYYPLQLLNYLLRFWYENWRKKVLAYASLNWLQKLPLYCCFVNQHLVWS